MQSKTEDKINIPEIDESHNLNKSTKYGLTNHVVYWMGIQAKKNRLSLKALRFIE